MKSKGLGDSIEKITKATGIKKAVDTLSDITGIDCGCSQRKERLNKLFPSNAPEMSDERINEAYLFIFGLDNFRLTSIQRHKLADIHRTYINPRTKVSSCPPCLRRQISDLKEFLKKD